MASRTGDWIDERIAGYIAERARPAPDAALVDLKQRTEALGGISVMQVTADQGALLTLLTRAVGADFAVEVGTFTGYSSISIARGLRPGGRLLCCDISDEYTAIAKEAWETAGVADVIELRVAPALDTLRSLPADVPIDVAFIDADKPSYPAYYEEILPRLRPGGLIAVDNTLWSGRVADPDTGDPGGATPDSDTEAMKAFNDAIAADDRVDSYILPISDGVTLIAKK